MTSTTAFTYDQLQEALDSLGVEDYEITTDYSGRGMYGDTCFGVILGDSGMVVGAAILLAVQATDGDEWDATEILRRGSTDSMGYQSIYYFPGWTLPDADEDRPATSYFNEAS